MLPILQIGPLVVPVPAILLLIGFWIGLDVLEKQSFHFKVDSGQLSALVLISLVTGLVGARLAYAARAIGAFIENPLNLLSPLPQMFDPLAGLLVALVVGLIVLWRKHMPLWPTLDALVSLFSILAVTLGLVHVASGDAFGLPSNVPWAINLWGEMRHPTQVYETLAALLVAMLVWPGRITATRLVRFSQSKPGFRFWVFLALSAGARILLETFRGDSLLLFNLFRQAQVIAWLILAISLWQIGRRLSNPEIAPAGEQKAAIR